MTAPLVFVDLVAQHAEVADEVAEGFARVLATTAFVGGPDVDRFEQQWARYTATRRAVGVASGTDALELALRAAGIGAGDEVIIPTNSFIATGAAVVRAGSTPVLVDCDEYGLIDTDQAKAAVTDRTRAIVPVHLFGQLAPTEALIPIALDCGAVVIEDAAQAHGARRHGKQAGALGAAAAYSFYPGKNLGAYGDGGAVVTNDQALAERVVALRNHGGEGRYQHGAVGFNSRLDTLQAVVLAAKLRHLDGWNAARRGAAARYDHLLAGLNGVRLPQTMPGNDHVWHLYTIRVAHDRDQILEALQAAGVPAGVHYPAPIHATPAFAALGYEPGRFPVAERAARQMVSLPMHPHLSAVQQQRVAEALADALRRG